MCITIWYFKGPFKYYGASVKWYAQRYLFINHTYNESYYEKKKADKNHEYEMNLKKHIKSSWKKLNRLYLSNNFVLLDVIFELPSKLFDEFKKIRAIKFISGMNQT